jgi:hypothetical protein
MTQEALRMALEALITASGHLNNEAFVKVMMARDAVVEALAQEQEPVAWMHVQGNYKEPSFRELADDEVERGWEQYPLYITPPQRSESSGKPSAWVGIEGEEIRNLWEEATKPDRSTMTMVTSFAKSIEAKLKEKNT